MCVFSQLFVTLLPISYVVLSSVSGGDDNCTFTFAIENSGAEESVIASVLLSTLSTQPGGVSPCGSPSGCDIAPLGRVEVTAWLGKAALSDFPTVVRFLYTR